MSDKLTCAKAPCKSCPYRRDVPSGVWAVEEYEKLPSYDGSIRDQLLANAGGLFMCHQLDGQLCAGWVGCHGLQNTLAGRITHSEVDPAVLTYKSPVPLFASGLAAAKHGMRAIRRPSKEAKAMSRRLARKLDLKPQKGGLRGR